MKKVLRPFIDYFIFVYLDDVLVYISTLEDHLIHIRKVLQNLHDAKLYLKRSKCEFGKQYLVYLGYIVGG